MKLKHLISLLGVATILVGCSSGPQEFATSDIKQATDNAKVVKGIFDSSKGDINKVSPADKAKLLDILKSEQAIKTSFEKMKNPSLGSGGGAPTPPPAQGK